MRQFVVCDIPIGDLQVLRKYRGIFGIFDKADVCGSLAGIKPERTEYR